MGIQLEKDWRGLGGVGLMLYVFELRLSWVLYREE